MPLAHREGQAFEGNRRLEDKLGRDIQGLLATTVPAGHTASSYREALTEIMRAYVQLFAALPIEDRAQVRQVDRNYFTEAIRNRQQMRRP